MKKRFSVLGIVAFVAIVAFSLSLEDCGSATGGPSGVGNPGDGKTPGGSASAETTYTATKSGVTYTLIVGDGVIKAAVGNNYKLIILSSGSEKISTGTVVEVTEKIILLKPSYKDAPNFSMGLSGSKITNISGTITFNNGESVQGPGSLAASGGGGGGGGGGAASTPSAPTVIAVTGVTLSPGSLNLQVGDKATLSAIITPANATNKSVTWSSSNNAVATVNTSGVVTAVSAGTANITVTTADGGKTAASSVTVNIAGGSSLTGSVTITGNAEAGQTLTANTGGLHGTGTISYEWKRGENAAAINTAIGTNSQTYTLGADDLNKYIAVTVTRDGYTGTVISAAVPVAKAVTLSSLTADGNKMETTTHLILTFSAAISGLSENDITLSGVSGVQKGNLTGPVQDGSGLKYTLPISGFNTGKLDVSVSKTGYIITNPSWTGVDVFHVTPVTLESVSADGSATQTTKLLTLTLNNAIADLNKDDITLSGVSGVEKGSLSGSGPSYTLPISGFTSGGTLEVGVAKEGYQKTPHKTVPIFHYTIPVITINTHPAANTSLTGGNSGSLTVAASVTGGAALSYQWYKPTTNSNTGTHTTASGAATNANYSTPSSLSAGIHYYYCEVRATGGADPVRSNVAEVIVTAPVITISTQPAAKIVTFGSISGQLSVAASVTGGATLSYQWGWSSYNSGGSQLAGETNSTFNIPAALDMGRAIFYYCDVKATGGATTVRSEYAMVAVIGPGNAYSWYVGKSSPYEIKTETELREFAKIVNGTWGGYLNNDTFSGKTVNLMADINLTGGEWTPIGVLNMSDASIRFSGTFNGNNRRISGLSITEAKDNAGLFAYISYGRVENLKVEGDITASANNYVGGVVARASNSSTVENCGFYGSVNGYNNVGGIVGSLSLGSVVKNCYNTGVVTCTYGGGVVGSLGSDTKIENCYNTGNVNSDFMAGGVAGTTTSGGTIKNCYNTGDIITNQESNGLAVAGGIIGYNQGNGVLIVENCYNTGTVTNTYTARGIGVGTINNCVSLGLLVSATKNSSAAYACRVGSSSQTRTNNKARSDMTVEYIFNYVPITGDDGTGDHGANIDVVTGVSNSEVFAGWDSNVWTIPSGNLSTIHRTLPTLKNVSGPQSLNPPMLPVH